MYDCKSLERGRTDDMVAYYMIFMNHELAKWCKKNNTGIFRVTQETEKGTEKRLLDAPHNIFLHHNPGIYSINQDNTVHQYLKMDCYIHITSPIRRVVDLLNMTMIQTIMGMLSEDGEDVRRKLYNKWTSARNMEKLNQDMKHITRVQNDTELINKVCSDPEILDKTYSGICTDIVTKSLHLKLYSVTFYIPELHIYKQITSSSCIELYKSYDIRLYVFQDVANVRRKIVGEILFKDTSRI
jgi:exoribonuclease II